MRPPALRKFVPATNSTTTCHSVDRNDLEALDGLCLEWRVDLEPSICAQEAIMAMQVAARIEQPPAIVPGSVGGDGLETRVLAALSIALFEPVVDEQMAGDQGVDASALTLNRQVGQLSTPHA